MRKLNPGEFNWNDRAVAELKALWFDGWSFSECGRRLGVSRSAVSGKLGRLGLLIMDRPKRERGASIEPARLRKLAEQALGSPPPPSPKPRPPIGSFDLMDLRYLDCRWPEGDYAPYAFCGAMQAPNSSYCEEHKQRSMSGHPHRVDAGQKYGGA